MPHSQKLHRSTTEQKLQPEQNEVDISDGSDQSDGFREEEDEDEDDNNNDLGVYLGEGNSNNNGGEDNIDFSK